MPSSNESGITRAHNILNVRKQLLAGHYRTLPNQKVMKVFKKAELIITKDEQGVETSSYGEAFPRGDFEWWHNPHWGDGEYAILIPMADVPTFERLLKSPRKNNDFCYDFEMEEVNIDIMMLTYCEISRYHENVGGQYDVLRSISRLIEAVDEISGQMTVIREGYMATVRLAMHTDEEAADLKIALQVVGAGIYRNTVWQDVPQDYVESMASGRMGNKYEAQRLMAEYELKRRQAEAVRALEPVSIDIPEEHQCEGIASTTGERCRMKGTRQFDGHYYCARHAPVRNESDIEPDDEENPYMAAGTRAGGEA